MTTTFFLRQSMKITSAQDAMSGMRARYIELYVVCLFKLLFDIEVLVSTGS
jgi:hypothetical protein